jgi:hypothetical protein
MVRYYNVLARTPDGHSDQAWLPKPIGDLRRELVSLFGEREDLTAVRESRLPLKKWFKAQDVVGLIERVEKDGRGNEVPELAQQAKVARLLRLHDEEGW